MVNEPNSARQDRIGEGAYLKGSATVAASCDTAVVKAKLKNHKSQDPSLKGNSSASSHNTRYSSEMGLTDEVQITRPKTRWWIQGMSSPLYRKNRC